MRLCSIHLLFPVIQQASGISGRCATIVFAYKRQQVHLCHACWGMIPGSPAALISIHVWQGGQVITDGVGRGSEVEDDVEPVAARDFLTDPTKLLSVGLPFVEDLRA